MAIKKPCYPTREIEWVGSESYLKEDEMSKACEKATFVGRLRVNGLSSLLDPNVGPRKKCIILKEANETKGLLMAEFAQRSMLASIKDSGHQMLGSLQ